MFSGVKWHRFYWLILAGTVLLVYLNSLDAPFLLDDFNAIVRNRQIRGIWPVGFKTRFLTDFTFKLNYMFTGLNPVDYRMVNVLLHIMSGLMLYGILRRSMAMAKVRPDYPYHSGFAFFISLIWLIHPLLTQSVVYICQRYEVLAGSFSLLSLYLFIRGVRQGRGRSLMAASIAACYCAVVAKETVAALLVLILLYDYVFISSSWLEILKKRWGYYTGLASSWGLLFLLEMHFMETVSSSNVQVFALDVGPWTYLMTQASVITHYIRLTFFPVGLCFDYYAWMPVENFSQVGIKFSFLALTGLLSALGVARKKAAAYPVIWFFALLAPTSSFFPLKDFAFEHRMYLPLIGVVVLSCYGANAFFLYIFSKKAPVTRRAIECVAGLSVVILLSILTVNRNKVYKSGRSMWADVVSKSPHNYRAYNGLISELMKTEEYSRVREVALAYLDVVAEGVDSPNTYRRQKALNHLDSAYNSMGRALIGEGRLDLAYDYFSKAVSFNPGHYQSHYNQALIAFTKDDMISAEKSLDLALKANGRYGKALELKAMIAAREGRTDDAVKFYRKALSRNPSLTGSKVGLAEIFATCPDYDESHSGEAVKWAQSAVEDTGGASYKALDILAAAYALEGKTLQAVQFAKKAIAIAEKSGDDEAAADIRQRLFLYRKGKAVRDWDYRSKGDV